MFIHYIPQPRCYGGWIPEEEPEKKEKAKSEKPRIIFKKGEKQCLDSK